MADNVLGALFSDIASAIREKSGVNVPMKPIDFPENILSIPVGTGGGSSGDSGNSGSSGVVGSGLKMASGTFTPSTLTKLLNRSANFARNPNWYDFYYWEESPAPFVLTSGTEYNVIFGTTGSMLRETAKTVRSIAGLTDCVIIGNEGLLDGEPGRSFLFIYSESENKLCCFTNIHDQKIPFDISKGKSEQLTIEHGLGVMPDLVMVYYAGALYYAPGGITSVWGLKSAFAEYTDVLGAMSGTGASSINTVYGIDNLTEYYQKAGFIFCPDENTFQIGETANSDIICKLVDGAVYNWIAMSGLGSVGSGGSMEGVHTVTFMSEDGQTELFKRPVADGDNCADPVARGLMDAPTKESTAQYDYTHAGWSATPGGSADSSVLNAVKADKTVYAAFTASTRYYTIRFFDGDTLLHTVLSEYGSTPAYTPTETPEESAFGGWSPELTPVTGDASYYVIWTNATPFLERQTLAFEQYSSTKYKPYLAKAEVTVPSNFAVGDEFVVEWDGIEYNCKCKYSEIKYTLSFGGTTSNLESSRNTLGNTGIISTLTKWNGYGISSVTPDATSEPFYMYTPSDGVLVIETQDTSATHTVRIKKQ